MTATVTPQLETYYAKRAREYERIYDKVERQEELAWLRERIPQLFAGRRVLEIACGTGYWTQFIAKTAAHVTACDINEPVLEIAREKPIAKGRATFVKADAFAPAGVCHGCDAAFAGFWWSHVRKSDLTRWLAEMAKALPPGALLAMLDNRYVEGSSTPLSRRDAEGNTYQVRPLLSGETHEVLKNFPTAAELAEAVRPFAAEAHLEETLYYWLLVFRLK
ncbi:MAG TPA: methyltransferase domain-containing protein [Usitatibacteraceae bacterium]|nr:methyltransferase domain-containing protein [Usitatibacteraceae bacterium]